MSRATPFHSVSMLSATTLLPPVHHNVKTQTLSDPDYGPRIDPLTILEFSSLAPSIDGVTGFSYEH